ncbi:uncharacterized protein DMAD_07345 [Drosophila madeirensis]|uniref:Uncharacterized protein n=1 Tax=Drosophila madeirensis TaxID=30013 RepID=A0AAU9FVF0_DROMD
MSANSSTSDVEDRLDNFFIRKPTHTPKSTDDPKSGAPIIHENIPLTLNDVLRPENARTMHHIENAYSTTALRHWK